MAGWHVDTDNALIVKPAKQDGRIIVIKLVDQVPDPVLRGMLDQAQRLPSQIMVRPVWKIMHQQRHYFFEPVPLADGRVICGPARRNLAALPDGQIKCEKYFGGARR
jgi:hypothetical protein